MLKSDNFGEKMKEFMQKYDKNSDGKIEMAEVSTGLLGGPPSPHPGSLCISSGRCLLLGTLKSLPMALRVTTEGNQ